MEPFVVRLQLRRVGCDVQVVLIQLGRAQAIAELYVAAGRAVLQHQRVRVQMVSRRTEQRIGGRRGTEVKDGLGLRGADAACHVRYPTSVAEASRTEDRRKHELRSRRDGSRRPHIPILRTFVQLEHVTSKV